MKWEKGQGKGMRLAEVKWIQGSERKAGRTRKGEK